MIVPTSRGANVPGAKRLALALTVSSLWALPALAQNLPQIPGFSQAEANGDLVFYGNYCGPGHRPGQPIDALDEACARHDACSPAVDSGSLPTCSCNARLAQEATLIANTPRPIPDDERAAAGFISVGAKALACR